MDSVQNRWWYIYIHIHIYKHTHTHIYIYIYIHTYQVLNGISTESLLIYIYTYTYRQTHTHAYIHIYVYIYISGIEWNQHRIADEGLALGSAWVIRPCAHWAWLRARCRGRPSVGMNGHLYYGHIYRGHIYRGHIYGGHACRGQMYPLERCIYWGFKLNGRVVGSW